MTHTPPSAAAAATAMATVAAATEEATAEAVIPAQATGRAQVAAPTSSHQRTLASVATRQGRTTATTDEPAAALAAPTDQQHETLDVRPRVEGDWLSDPKPRGARSCVLRSAALHIAGGPCSGKCQVAVSSDWAYDTATPARTCVHPSAGGLHRSL
mmetsp:Transcript_22232/g.67542  ORF Transcript_22232/g.67542 Transcript_22232/m.67542 type:complete len:156 (-) Transcript_22232:636-1103(-)